MILHRPHPLAIHRRGFTLLEVMLACVLGTLMIGLCFALLGAMSRSQTRLATRVDQAMTTATAHRALLRAFSNLLMSDQPEPGEDQLDTLKKEELKTAKDESLSTFSTDPHSARIAIQPDLQGPRLGQRPAQIVFLTLRTPPIYGGETVDADEFDRSGLDRRNKKDKSRFNRDSSGSGSRTVTRNATATTSTSRGSGMGSGAGSGATLADALARVQQATGGQPIPVPGAAANSGNGAATGSEDQTAAALGPGGQAFTDPARAVGVRGVFELLPELPDPKRRNVATENQEQAWALWWREIPPEAPTGPQGTSFRDKDLAAFEGTRQVRKVKLLGGLKTARWSVFRDGDFYPKIATVWASHLPAYVQFQYETIDGRREDWVFEVGWALGPDPGSVLPSAKDQFNQNRGADGLGSDGPTPLDNVPNPVPASNN